MSKSEFDIRKYLLVSGSIKPREPVHKKPTTHLSRLNAILARRGLVK